jgi:hypothetical protein
MRYGESKGFFSMAAAARSGMRQRSAWARRRRHDRTVDALIHSGGDHNIQISSFPEAIVLKA